MSNIQNTLDSLQPYVISIRYLKGVPLVDVVLNDGWTVIDDPLIKRVKGDEALNYFMIFSEEPGVGLDDLLAYVDKIIKANIDREKKHELLKAKVNELKEVFKRNSLAKLHQLKFTFGEDEDFNTNISDVDLTETVIEPNPIQKVEAPIEEDIEETTPSTNQPITYLDENKQPIELTEEDKEILAEEAKKRNSEGKPPLNKVELPPKRKAEIPTTRPQYNTDCECGPNDACEKCIDSKGY